MSEFVQQEINIVVDAMVKDGLAFHVVFDEFMPGWRITHVESGRRVAQCTGGPDDAAALVDRLLAVADWTQSGKDITLRALNDLEFRKRLVDAGCEMRFD